MFTDGEKSGEKLTRRTGIGLSQKPNRVVDNKFYVWSPLLYCNES